MQPVGARASRDGLGIEAVRGEQRDWGVVRVSHRVVAPALGLLCRLGVIVGIAACLAGFPGLRLLCILHHLQQIQP